MPRRGSTRRADALAATVGADGGARVKHRHRLTGVVAPAGASRAIAAALHAGGLEAVDHVHELHRGEVPLFGPEQVKGLEFDGVVVVNPTRSSTARREAPACCTWR